MVSTLIILILLISGGVLTAYISRQAFEKALPLWAFIIIAILYVFSILGILEAGVYFIAAFGAAAVIFDIAIIISKKIKLSTLITPGFVVFILFVLFSWWAQRGRLFSIWDEFSHWGLVVKNMYTLNVLPNSPEATTYFINYPPGTALFEYLWVKLSGVYQESTVYQALNILYFSLMLPLFTELKWADFTKIIVRIIFIIVLPLVFYQDLDFYTSIYVDGILGLVFAYTLISYFTYDTGTFSFVNIGMSLFTLTLIKDSGTGLSLIILVIIALDLLIFRRKELNTYMYCNKQPEKLKHILTAICPLILTAIAKISWVLYLKSMGTGTAVFGVKSIFSIPSYGFQTMKNFIKALFITPISNGIIQISFIGWIAILLFIGAIFILLLCRKEERKRYIVDMAVVLIFAFIYAGYLLFLYIFNFSEYESVNLASFQRYISTYMLGALSFFSVLIFINVKKQKEAWKKYIPAGILLLILVSANLSSIKEITVSEHGSASDTQALRSEYSGELNIAKTLDAKKDKLYFISAGDKGLDYWIARYNFTPVKINDNFTWSIGEPYFQGDIWTKNESVEDWAKVLDDGFTYVYVCKTNDGFSEEFGGLFEGGKASIHNNTLYHIEKSGRSVILKKSDVS